MERVRQVRDAIKNRYSKPCCIKLGIGIGIGVLLLVVVIVVSTVAGGDGGGEGDNKAKTDQVNSKGDATSSTSPSGVASVTQPSTPQGPVDWPHQFTVRLNSQGSTQTLSVDDVGQRYVIEVSHSQYYSLYIIVDFQKRQHTYVIMEKGGNDAISTSGKERVLYYCDTSSFPHDSVGAFTPSATLREGGGTYQAQVGGRTVTVNAAYKGSPFTVPPALISIMQGSCRGVPEDRSFQWNSKYSECGGNTTAAVEPHVCSNQPCPNFEKTSLSSQEACDSFRKCNYVMSACDSSWTQPYDQRPYCGCRRALVNDLDNMNCPDEGENGGECSTSKRKIQDFEKAAGCYCRYRISRIYPKISPTTAAGTINWEITATVRTAPIVSYDQCSC